MRPWLLMPAVVLCAFPPGAPAQSPSGGVAAPTGSGGAEYGVPVGAKRSTTRPRRGREALRATRFAVEPGELRAGGPPARISYLITGAARRVRVRVELLREGQRTAAAVIRLGWKPTGVRRVNRWTMPSEGLPKGRYVARLHAVDDRGGTLRRSTAAPGRTTIRVAGPPAVATGSGSFPIQGQWTWGGEGSEFGAERGTHRHQGQDLMAAEGTPVVSPRAGHVYWRAYQARGAGHYLGVRADDGRDLVFMHLQAGSLLVDEEDPVAAGQVIAKVGSTGRSDGAHLHFEIWPCGWYAKGCRPIDPRPDLEAWASGSR